MKRFIAIVMLTVALAANAQLLWRIEPRPHNNAAPTYIYGTCHVASPDLMTQRALAAIDNASVVVGEIVLDSMSTPGAMTLFDRMSLAPADSTLMAVLSQAQVDSVDFALNVVAGTTQVPYVRINNSRRPVVLENALTMLLAAKAFPDFAESGGLDTFIQTRARQRGKPVEGLEGIEDQLKVLYGKPIDSQVEDLMSTVRDLKHAHILLEEILQTYLNGELDTLFELMNEEARNQDSAYLDALIYRRNRNWMWPIERYINAGGAFVAVGAAHLPGDNGIIELLKRAGYDVTPVE